MAGGCCRSLIRCEACILEWTRSYGHCPKCRAVDLKDNIHKVAGLCEALAPLEKLFLQHIQQLLFMVLMRIQFLQQCLMFKLLFHCKYYSAVFQRRLFVDAFCITLTTFTQPNLPGLRHKIWFYYPAYQVILDPASEPGPSLCLFVSIV